MVEMIEWLKHTMNHRNMNGLHIYQKPESDGSSFKKLDTYYLQGTQLRYKEWLKMINKIYIHFLHCCNKLPQTQWLKTKQMYHVTVL
jgi:hypothetical protein